LISKYRGDKQTNGDVDEVRKPNIAGKCRQHCISKPAQRAESAEYPVGRSQEGSDLSIFKKTKRSVFCGLNLDFFFRMSSWQIVEFGNSFEWGIIMDFGVSDGWEIGFS